MRLTLLVAAPSTCSDHGVLLALARTSSESRRVVTGSSAFCSRSHTNTSSTTLEGRPSTYELDIRDTRNTLKSIHALKEKERREKVEGLATHLGRIPDSEVTLNLLRMFARLIMEMPEEEMKRKQSR